MYIDRNKGLIEKLNQSIAELVGEGVLEADEIAKVPCVDICRLKEARIKYEKLAEIYRKRGLPEKANEAYLGAMALVYNRSNNIKSNDSRECELFRARDMIKELDLDHMEGVEIPFYVYKRWEELRFRKFPILPHHLYEYLILQEILGKEDEDLVKLYELFRKEDQKQRALGESGRLNEIADAFEKKGYGLAASRINLVVEGNQFAYYPEPPEIKSRIKSNNEE